MCRLFESLKVENRELFNIEYHNRRLNDSRKIIFGSPDLINLKDAVAVPDRITNAVYKCRVIYKENILSFYDSFVSSCKQGITSTKVLDFVEKNKDGTWKKKKA